MSSMLIKYLKAARAPVVLADGTTPGFADSIRVPRGVEKRLVRPGWAPGTPASIQTIVVAVPHADALRRLGPLLTGIGRKAHYAIYLADADEPLVVRSRPEWPAVRDLTGRTADGEALTTLDLARPFPARLILREFARSVARQSERDDGALVVGLSGEQPGLLPFGWTLRLGDRMQKLVGDAVEVPPDVVFTSATPGALTTNPVLGRPPVVVDGRTLVAPVDEMVVNPIGYLSDVTGPLAEVQAAGDSWRIGAPSLGVLVDRVGGVSARQVDRLRQVSGVHLEWPEAPAEGLVRIVAGLAMAGVPVGGGPVPAWADPILGALAPLVGQPLDFASGLARDELSVHLRRAAFAEHSTYAARRRLAAAAGVRGPEHPAVSLLLVTKRPEMLEHALAQVARQRGVDLELVLATHGFKADPAAVEAAVPGARVAQLGFAEDAIFGDVLTAAAQAASGDVLLKFDDDDWYGPDVVTDLLLARRFSGAPVVGMPAEFAYLEPVDTTIRRNDPVELYTFFVAGGTTMIDRGLLRSIGWFRSVKKYVDRQLLVAAQESGASIYRTHGLGYVMRRTSGGHTWDAGIDYFLDESRVRSTSPGFTPSALLEA